MTRSKKKGVPPRIMGIASFVLPVCFHKFSPADPPERIRLHCATDVWNCRKPKLVYFGNFSASTALFSHKLNVTLPRKFRVVISFHPRATENRSSLQQSLNLIYANSDARPTRCPSLRTLPSWSPKPIAVSQPAGVFRATVSPQGSQVGGLPPS